MRGHPDPGRGRGADAADALAAWLFAASALAQIAYLFFIAPRYFDRDDPPDPRGRQQSTNAFVVYAAATLFVLWGAFKGRLLSWQDVPWPLLAAAGAALAAHVVHVLRLVTKPMASGGASAFGSADGAAAPTPEERAQSSASRLWRTTTATRCGR